MRVTTFFMPMLIGVFSDEKDQSGYSQTENDTMSTAYQGNANDTSAVFDAKGLRSEINK
ncbi:unnamed protein product [Nippostrongylus brasiliensis]|uniref:Conjugal transfer protein TraN n=1 Tax=Nippostrongylus brasiliensis TaxID=27835 RepID=A0A0N4XF31_NIPBR|nr:unnamed protein product [Nippostrongylus brasiliensis]